jgi:hypothetical protein
MGLSTGVLRWRNKIETDLHLNQDSALPNYDSISSAAKWGY